MAKGESYEEFVEKFKPKLTTDDCYTPEAVYEVVADWVTEKYGIARARMVRPFWPGANFERFDYPAGCVVVDNPPFSIIAKICKWYLENNIQFYLFAPSLTLIGCCTMDTCHVFTESDITYANEAVVHSGFITNLEPDVIAKTEPELGRRLREKEKSEKEHKRKPAYAYPANIVTGAMLQKYARYGIDLTIRKNECALIRKMDAQTEMKKTIYGAGLLLSERAAAERAAAERAAAERAAADRAAAERAAAITWKLSDREKEIIKELNRKSEVQ